MKQILKLFLKRGEGTCKVPSTTCTFKVALTPSIYLNSIILKSSEAMFKASLSFFILVPKVCEFNNFFSQGDNYARLGIC